MPDQENTLSNQVTDVSAQSPVEPSTVQSAPPLDDLAPPPKKPFPKSILVFLVFLLVVVAGVRGWFWLDAQLTTNSQSTDQTELAIKSSTLTQSAFRYEAEKTIVTPSLNYGVATLDELSNLANFQAKDSLTDSQLQTLASRQFVMVDNNLPFFNQSPDSPTGRTDDWTYLYGQIGGGHITERKPENAVFITTDFVLHIFHRLLEKELEYLEKTTLYKKVTTLTNQLYAQSISDYKTATDPLEKASFARLAAFFAVPKAMLETSYQDLEGLPIDTASDKIETMLLQLKKLEGDMPPEAYQQAAQELNLIIEAKKITSSPLFGRLQSEAGLAISEDYTQYQPRSHYNKSALLRTYFRVMMWYGRANFLAKSPELTRDALHIVSFFQEETAAELWNSIALPTAFLVGKSDDLTWSDYQPVVETLGTNSFTSKQISTAMDEIAKLRDPQIQGSVVIDPSVLAMSKDAVQNATKGFRLFGQRVVPDAVIFSTLTQGQELPDATTGQRLPSATTSLMVMSTLGLPSVEPLVQDWIGKNAPDSDRVLADKRQQLAESFASLEESDWTQNVYWSWLYAIKALGLHQSELVGYPAFMQDAAWQHKNLQTALGSWTELKHDTLLYAKQSYAEMGAGGESPTPPPVPKGYVEPNIALFDRLIALQKMKQKGLSAYGLLDGMFESRNQALLESLVFFRDMAVKQLQNEAINDDEFEALRTKAAGLSWVVAVLPGEEQTEAAARTALIADIHTDVPGASVLYVANDIPDFIYVLVKDKHGARMTKGLVYRQYEFTQPLTKRLTDESWHERVYQDADTLPALAPFAAALRP